MITARIQANQRCRARLYRDRRYQRWCMWRTRHKGRATISLRGGSPDEPRRCPGQSLFQHNPRYTRHPAWCPFDLIPRLAFADGAFMCLYTKNSYKYFPPGCGRSWSERTKPQWCHQVCHRPPRMVEKASLMSSPGAPELQNVIVGQNLLLGSVICG